LTFISNQERSNQMAGKRGCPCKFATQEFQAWECIGD